MFSVSALVYETWTLVKANIEFGLLAFPIFVYNRSRSKRASEIYLFEYRILFFFKVEIFYDHIFRDTHKTFWKNK